MALPENISALLDRGLETVNVRPDGHLPLLDRCRIWTALGPSDLDEKERARVGPGVVRRVHLGMCCVQHVVDIWASKRPRDTTVADMLSGAQQYLRREISYRKAGKCFDRGWLRADNLGVIADDYKSKSLGWATMVCYAAAMTVKTAMYDEMIHLSTLEADPGEEGDFDPDMLDAAVLASVAFARGWPRARKSRPEKRCEYWTWYLTSAVAQAWGSWPG